MALWRLGAVGLLRTVLVIFSVSVAAFALTVLVLGRADGSSPEALRDAVQGLNELYRLMESVNGVWLMASSALLLLILLMLIRRGAKIKGSRMLQEHISQELDRLRGQCSEGQLPPLPPSDEMLTAQADIAGIEEKLAAAALRDMDIPDNWRHLDALRRRRIELRALHHEFDLLRRVELDGLSLDGEALLPAGHGWQNAIRSLFTSAGLVAATGRISRAGFTIGTCLLVACLIGVSSGASSSSAQARIVELQELYVEATRARASRSWEQLRGTPDQGALSGEDLAMLDQLSRIYEQQLLDDAAQRLKISIGAGVVTAAVVTGAAIRYQLMKGARLSPEVEAIGVQLDPDHRYGRVLRQTLEDTGLREGPRTSFGRRARKEFATAVRKMKPDVRAALRNQIRLLRTPARIDHVTRGILANVLSHAADGGDTLGNGAQQFLDIEKSARRNYAGALTSKGGLHGATAEVSTHAELWPNHEVREVRLAARDRLPRPGELQRHLRQHPPSLGLKVRDQAKIIRLERALSRLDAGYVSRGLRSAASYDDLFPIRSVEGKGLLSTIRRKLVARGTLRDFRIRDLVKPARAARSFRRLLGSARVGGVLIGREAMRGSIDIIELDWTIDEQGVLLQLITRDEIQHYLGPFDPALVEAALLYTADERPTSVTIQNQPLLPDQKIHLHHAFLDTQLGCDLIRLDKLTLDPLGDDVRYQRALSDFYAADTLYGLAHLARRGRLLRRFRSGLGEAGLPLKEIDELQAQQTKVLEARATQYRGSLDDHWPRLLNPKASPLAEKSHYYEPELVSALRVCADRSVAWTGVQSCIESQYATREIEDLRWLLDPPGAAVVGGVREVEYEIDDRLDFAGSRATHAVRFLVQVVFEEPLADSDADGDEPYIDDSPWDFPNVADHLRAKIDAVIGSKPENVAVMARVNEFTRIQRLVRMGLSGSLGSDFPMGRLVALQRSLSSLKRPHVETARWVPRPGALEAMLASAITPFLDSVQDREVCPSCPSIAARARRCLQLIKKQVNSRSAPDVWSGNCEFGPAPSEAPVLLKQLHERARIITDLRDLRQALGVHRSEDILAGNDGRYCRGVP